MEKLTSKEVVEIINHMKSNGEYQKFWDMILDDFEEHNIVYTLDNDEIIALAYKNNTIPFKMQEFYNWHEINILTEEDLD